MYTDLTFSPHTSFGMGIKLALNFIWNGIKKALKSLEFHLEDPGGTLPFNRGQCRPAVSLCVCVCQAEAGRRLLDTVRLLERQREEDQVDRAAVINTLTQRLEESQQQCAKLLHTGMWHPMCFCCDCSSLMGNRMGQSSFSLAVNTVKRGGWMWFHFFNLVCDVAVWAFTITAKL